MKSFLKVFALIFLMGLTWPFIFIGFLSGPIKIGLNIGAELWAEFYAGAKAEIPSMNATAPPASAPDAG